MSLDQVDGAVENVLVQALELRLDGGLRLGVDAVDPEILLRAALWVDVPLVHGLDDVRDVGVGRGILFEAPANYSESIFDIV